MIYALFILVLIVYFTPLIIFCIALIVSRNFWRRTSLLNILEAMTDQLGRIRDIIATIFVPLLALFTIKPDRAARVDLESMAIAIVFLLFALI